MTLALSSPLARVAYVAVWAASVAGAFAVGGFAEPAVWAGFLLPDLPLVFGLASGLAPGQLHPRAVPSYNAVHTLLGPALLAASSLLLGPAALAGALAWLAHIAIDRAVGYGLRTPDGFQRG
jgi:hypothetical protein